MRFTVLAILGLALLASCGASRSDRAISGGAIGAGVGAVGSAITGGDTAAGALIGGAVGAAAGGLTDPEDLDLGEPFWRRRY